MNHIPYVACRPCKPPRGRYHLGNDIKIGKQPLVTKFMSLRFYVCVYILGTPHPPQRKKNVIYNWSSQRIQMNL